MMNWELEVPPRGPNAEDRDILRRYRPARKAEQRARKALRAAIAAERLEQLARDAERDAGTYAQHVRRIVTVEIPQRLPHVLTPRPPIVAPWEPVDGGWISYSRILGVLCGHDGRAAIVLRRAARQAAAVVEQHKEDKIARVENEMDSYPFCRVCHGAGGREIPASHLGPAEREECSACDGKTSRCKKDSCFCFGDF